MTCSAGPTGCLFLWGMIPHTPLFIVPPPSVFAAVGGKVRKRLSVVSDNVLIEGLEKATLEVDEMVRARLCVWCGALKGAFVLTPFRGAGDKSLRVRAAQLKILSAPASRHRF